MNNPATTTAPDTLAAMDAKEESLIDEVLRQTPYVTAPRFAMPTNWAEIEAMAKRICDAGWCPKSHRINDKPNQASVELAILQGMELKVSPMMAVQGIAIINGVPAIWGDLMLAVIPASGLLEWKKETLVGEGDDMRAVCRVKRLGRPEPIERVFTWAMAKHAGLAQKKGPWQAYGPRMLAMRARSWCLRDEFADVLRGMASMEELRDSGALARAIEVTEAQVRAGGVAASITDSLKNPGQIDNLRGPATGQKPSGEDAKINTPASTSKHDGKSAGGSTASATVDSPTPHDPDTGEIRDEPATVGVDPAGEGEDRTAVMHHNSAGTIEPGTTADLLSPAEAEWMAAAKAMMDRIDDADSIADLDVIVASGHVKPELDRMAKAAPQQHEAVTGFIAEKRAELG